MIGDGAIAEEIKHTIAEHPQLGYAINAELDEKTAYATPQEIKTIARHEDVNLIIISSKLKHEPALVAVLYELFASGIAVTDLVAFYESIMRKVPLLEIQETWFIENIAMQVSFYDPLKRASEFIGAVALGIILIPFEIIIALLVAFTSRGPIIYKQVRVGEKGKNFTLYKFRTMRVDAEAAGAQWAVKNDTRTTPIGGLLRKSHLDELPQLWNIIRGDLSFVGPRPERPEFVAKLETRIPYYEARLFIKPGVTGWAQINHRADLTDADVIEKLQYDIYYLKNRSPILDWAIILKTIKSLFVNPE
jgi:exopolysaccharide biosynthesis polyprenyl glycosylphosphotransferase